MTYLVVCICELCMAMEDRVRGRLTQGRRWSRNKITFCQYAYKIKKKKMLKFLAFCIYIHFQRARRWRVFASIEVVCREKKLMLHTYTATNNSERSGETYARNTKKLDFSFLIVNENDHKKKSREELQAQHWKMCYDLFMNSFYLFDCIFYAPIKSSYRYMLNAISWIVNKNIP